MFIILTMEIGFIGGQRVIVLEIIAGTAVLTDRFHTVLNGSIVVIHIEGGTAVICTLKQGVNNEFDFLRHVAVNIVVDQPVQDTFVGRGHQAVFFAVYFIIVAHKYCSASLSSMMR